MSETLGYPKGFKEYQRLFGDRHSIRDIGFAVGPGDINRFAQRVRMARSFEGINLGGYTDSTQAGYEGLMRVFLTHSAVERFLPLLFGKETHSRHHVGKFTPLLQSYDQDAVMRTFRERDPNRAFWEFFRGQCDEGLRKRLDRCDSGEDVNVFQVSAGIRHIFVHGHLTPSARNAKPKNVRMMCDQVAQFTIDFIDQEFYMRVKAYCDMKGLDWFDKQGMDGEELMAARNSELSQRSGGD